MTEFVVHTGRMAEVSFGPYTGSAGLQDAGGKIAIAFTAQYRDIRDVTSGTVDGEPVVVTSVARSMVIDGMVVVTVEVTPPAA